MKIKTFYARTMAEALQSIKSELGSDAVLLSSKEISRRPGLRFHSAAAVEVVAAVDSASDPTLLRSMRRSEPPATESPENGSEEEALELEKELSCSRPPAQLFAKVKTEIQAGLRPERNLKTSCQNNEKFHDCVQSSPEAKNSNAAARAFSRGHAPTFMSPFAKGAVLDVYRELLSAGVNEWLAYELLNQAQESLSSSQLASCSEVFGAVLEIARDRISESLSQDGMPRNRVIVFVGPTGVGKTTSLAKLAARLALEQKKNVVLMTLDGFRIAAVEQLRTYAGLMGVPFRCVNQVADLAQEIDDHKRRDYVLIDTAGRGPKDLNAMDALADFLQQSSEVETHLVLSATTKAVDMEQIVDRFGVCRPDHLLFTKLDETSNLGPIFNELVRTQKPLSYFSDGQRVPEDLHSLPKERIVDMLLHVH